MIKKIIRLYRKIFPLCVISDDTKHKGFCKTTTMFYGQISVPMCKAHRNNLDDLQRRFSMPPDYGITAKDILGK